MNGKVIRALFLASLLLFGFIPYSFAQDELPEDNGIFGYHEAPRYRDSESHPLRVVAYVLHPVGWVLREAIFRPWSAFAGSTRFTRSFFGFREPYDYRDPICFDASDQIPDCHSMAPYNALATGPRVEGEGDGDQTASLLSERQIYFPDINFEFDKSNLTELGRGRVRQIAQLLASVPSLKVVVEGHADYKGTDEYNLALGSRRAEAVMKELTELGVDPARMSPISYGESKPIFAEEEDWARAANRRVQFTVEGAGGAPASATAPAETQSSSLPPAAELSNVMLTNDGPTPRGRLASPGEQRVIRNIEDAEAQS